VTLPEVGADGQARIAAARVLVVGVGGLGCPAVHYLAAAGVGRLCLVDGDRVRTTDLHRQLLFGTADVGRSKVEAAAQCLREQGHATEVRTVPEHLSAANALPLVAAHDLVLDCTDDLAARYLINDACVQAGRPFVHGSLHRFAGQVAVFNHGEGPTYRCLFPREPVPGEVPNCADTGVLGVLPGTVGLLQATEALKLILGTPGLLSGRVLLVDLLAQEHRTIAVQRDAQQVQRAMQRLLGDAATGVSGEAPGISAEEFIAACANGEAWQCVDVRLPHEEPRAEGLGAHRIPMQELPARVHELDPARPTLVFCQHGIRSLHVTHWLRTQGFARVRSLEGGVLAWQQCRTTGHQRTLA
jgi:adenylyltransferase/sulfurtransferase